MFTGSVPYPTAPVNVAVAQHPPARPPPPHQDEAADKQVRAVQRRVSQTYITFHRATVTKNSSSNNEASC